MATDSELLDRLLAVIAPSANPDIEQCLCLRGEALSKALPTPSPMPTCAFHSNRLWSIVVEATLVARERRMREGARG